MNEYFTEFQKIKNSLDKNEKRSSLVKKYSWAIPTNKVLQAILKYSPLVEIGAGTGYWAMLLTELGAKVTCYDKYLTDNPYRHKITWHNINHDDENILTTIPSDTNLFLCWPLHDDNMALKCLKLFKGKYFIYIGEDMEGCNANDDFFQELYINWVEIEKVIIPQWSGIHDLLSIYKRKEVQKNE